MYNVKALISKSESLSPVFRVAGKNKNAAIIISLTGTAQETTFANEPIRGEDFKTATNCGCSPIFEIAVYTNSKMKRAATISVTISPVILTGFFGAANMM